MRKCFGEKLKCSVSGHPLFGVFSRLESVECPLEDAEIRGHLCAHLWNSGEA